MPHFPVALKDFFIMEPSVCYKNVGQKNEAKEKGDMYVMSRKHLVPRP